MKQSKILKTLSYILLSITIASLILSMIYIGCKNSPYYNKQTYFSSSKFANDYMATLAHIADKLIHDNNEYESVQDGDMQIFYVYNYYSEEGYRVSNYVNYTETTEMNFLIIYKNKAITDVNLGTIEAIKQYIYSAENTKEVTILNGVIQTDSESILQHGYKYLNSFTIPYYTTETESTDIMLSDGRFIEYITPEAKDFQIYSSYEEELYQNANREMMIEFLNMISPFVEYIYVVLPISSVITILLMVYLVISIGRKKGEKGISLNDFDKIPLEIIIFIAIIIGCIPFISLTEISDDYNAIISLLITAYLVIYIISAIIFNTLIKRIKSKTFLKSSISGKLILFIIECCNKVKNKIKNVWKTFTYSTNTTVKVISYCVILAIIALLILGIFQDSVMTILLEMLLAGFLIYKIVRIIKEFSQIENKLKEMYNGENKNELEITEFIPSFQNTVKYLNDISNGFENAIQDRMKSERLKAELITNVSHDIKTPLTSIINYVDLLKKEDIKNEKAKEYIGILDNKSQRLKKLTEDLVEASKVSTGNISLNLEKINVVELIKQATGEFQDKFKKRGLETIISCEENEINIMADSRYMYRIVENLFSNISKYALENSRVYIDINTTEEKMDKSYLTSNAHTVIIEMKNISKDRLNISAEELIQRFVRGDKSRTTEGSGLGISISQNLTELQNGKFELKLDGDLFKVELVFNRI